MHLKIIFLCGKFQKSRTTVITKDLTQKLDIEEAILKEILGVRLLCRCQIRFVTKSMTLHQVSRPVYTNICNAFLPHHQF